LQEPIMARTHATVIEQRSACVIVHVQPHCFDHIYLEAVQAETTTAGQASPGLPVVLDLAGVGVLSSMALGGLIELTRAFRARDQRLILANLHPFVRQTISLASLDKVFEIVGDLSGFAP
jgi:anti-anti-sigma factor